jgi:hypothetical protein
LNALRSLVIRSEDSYILPISNPAPTIFDETDDEHREAALATAEASIAADHVISHGAMRR